MSARAQAPTRRPGEAAIQPGLPLQLAPSAGLGRLALEVSTPCAEPFDADGWVFTVDWEGSRCLLASDGAGTTVLQGETMDLTDRFPEVVAAAGFLAAREALLEGTVCVLDREGRPDLAALCARAAAGSSRPLAVLLVTDLLHLDGEPLRARPLETRLALLAQLIPADLRIQVPDHVAGHGRALAAAAEARGLSAMLARRAAAPYRPAVASPDRLRIALRDRLEDVVLGWRRRAGATFAVLGDWRDGRLSAHAEVGVDEDVALRWLTGADDSAAGADLGAADNPRWAGVTWVRPRLVATVERRLSASAGDPGAWELVAVRDDVDPRWCIRRTPIAPPQASAREPLRPFSPTVLSALPLDASP